MPCDVFIYAHGATTTQRNWLPKSSSLIGNAESEMEDILNHSFTTHKLLETAMHKNRHSSSPFLEQSHAHSIQS